MLTTTVMMVTSLDEDGCKRMIARMLHIEVKRAQRGDGDAITYIHSKDACAWASLLGLTKWELWTQELGDEPKDN